MINIEIENDYELFSNFIKDYKNYNENNSVYEMFNCEILKNDLIDFYDSTFNNLNKYALIHFYCHLFIGIVIFVSNYFIIRLLNEFYIENYIEEEEDEKKENKSDKPLVNKNENENNNDNNNNDNNSINNNNNTNNKVPSVKENSVKSDYTPNKDYFNNKVINDNNNNNNNVLNLNNNLSNSLSNQNKNSTFNNSAKNETEQ